MYCVVTRLAKRAEDVTFHLLRSRARFLFLPRARFLFLFRVVGWLHFPPLRLLRAGSIQCELFTTQFTLYYTVHSLLHSTLRLPLPGSIDCGVFGREGRVGGGGQEGGGGGREGGEREGGR